MEILQRYELILAQALEELAALGLEADSDEGLDLDATLAPPFGDILYRLTVEHGVGFTPFRETVLSLISESEPHRAVAGSRSGRLPGRNFAASLAQAHGLIILALEMMPPDAPF
jgi:hypothetical protein